MSCPAGPPPDYETVVKQREEEENGLPTYSVVSTMEKETNKNVVIDH
jgi:hypothetical protein